MLAKLQFVIGEKIVESLNNTVLILLARLLKTDRQQTEGNYSPQQIYNADETGLNFRALPKKSLASQDEKSAPGYKMSKDRVTLRTCSNAFGNHKFPLMVIGKSAKPRAFKNVNMKSLPVYYRSQKKSMNECNVV
ncbi:tigger transposable element-derived protein 2 [Trichonephila clavipes]|uniref:Tigger transposable element-derived protein 2 n=1 Tax=Trichonephila clavipes TaxID=2585209 RepID=A0A8X6VG33_TRICX|nr:tigger transposable element-derived protein 2 [Trichonephila clavipes]